MVASVKFSDVIVNGGSDAGAEMIFNHIFYFHRCLIIYSMYIV